MQKRKVVSIIFAALGVCLILFGLYRTRIQKYKYSFAETPQPAYSSVEQDDKDVEQEIVFKQPNKIVISSLGVDLPVEISTINDGIWEVSDEAVSFLDRSAKPGEGGNIVLYGHNKRHILGTLPNIRVGDVIEVYDEDGKEYKYQVENTFIVTPDDVSVVQPTDHEVLTVYTCVGPFDSKRFIVKAKPLIISE